MAVSVQSSSSSFAGVLYLRQGDLILASAFCFLRGAIFPGDKETTSHHTAMQCYFCSTVPSMGEHAHKKYSDGKEKSCKTKSIHWHTLVVRQQAVGGQGWLNYVFSSDLPCRTLVVRFILGETFNITRLPFLKRRHTQSRPKPYLNTNVKWFLTLSSFFNHLWCLGTLGWHLHMCCYSFPWTSQHMVEQPSICMDIQSS